MTASKQIILLFCILLPLLTTAENLDNQTYNETNKGNDNQIEALEKQKEDLYKQIKTAINDSIKILEESDANDTEASAVKSLIGKLEKQMDVLSGKNTTEQVYDNLADIGDTRRRGKSGKKKYHVKRRAKGNAGYFSDKGQGQFKGQDKLGALFEDKLQNKKGKRGKERFLNRYLMEKRVADWLKAKAEEKKRIETLVINQMAGPKQEGCPNWGIDKKKARKGKKGSKKKEGIVPCCRKCCKHSYMGCLKK